MCGICGYISFKRNYIKSGERERAAAKMMADTMYSRGPDSGGEWVGEHAVFAHRRLAVIDPERGKQPMKRVSEGYEFIITYNGELYNAAELRRGLERRGYKFDTTSDTEVLLYMYIHYGDECANHLNGIFAFAVYDSMRQSVFLCRDRFGVKPLFYSEREDAFVFGSEIKALLKYPGIEARLDREGLCELFAISPARTAGCGVFKGIKELKPGHCMRISRRGICEKTYWRLRSAEHTDSYNETVEKVRFLLTDAIKRQLVSDVPIATFLSGGLDSSFITAVAAMELKKQGKQLSTYSFDYEDNDKYFRSTKFQPDSDTEWVPRMAEEFGTDHTYLVCPNDVLVPMLDDALRAKDMPGMADCDSSLLYFCREVKKRHTVALSGECSDEIFGGYPWFRDPHAFETPAFPWCYDLSMRKEILTDSVRRTLDLDGYSRMRYEESVRETPQYCADNAEERRRREISWLNINWFMTNLLDRKDRMSMASGLEVRVPFCDHRLVEYVWNIPWEMKNRDNISKNILREAAKGILPEDVRLRRKSPYPKTHNPFYEAAVKARLKEIVEDVNAPLLSVCDRGKLYNIINGEFDYGKPFFGQLMAGPQFIGFLVQVNTMLDEYDVRFV
ncbi:MAG: asparagine synthase (glutamine-hydrolyzing) [Clostridiales bacterium]|nr:asparagine synthase (glutamine-hydrolyzing) [Clostridiales bacterium]